MRSGFNVYPCEVEELLISHPDVSLAAVLGVVDERVGEKVNPVVVVPRGWRLTSARARWSSGISCR